jgi:hypothetical protein
MKKLLMSFIVLISLFVLASCGSSPSASTVGVPTHQPGTTTASGTPTTRTTSPDVQPTVSALPAVVHLQVGAGVQLVHFYVTVPRAELKSIQTPPSGMTYLLVTANLRNTTNLDRPLLPANFILHDATSGKAYFPHIYSGAPVPPYGVVKSGATVLGPLVFLVPVPSVRQNYTFTFQWTGGLAQASWDVVI